MSNLTEDGGIIEAADEPAKTWRLETCLDPSNKDCPWIEVGVYTNHTVCTMVAQAILTAVPGISMIILPVELVEK